MLIQLTLLGRFSLTVDARTEEVDTGSARILALLALHGRAGRNELAATLWPAACRDRALANLRAGLWRMPALARGLISGHCHDLGLEPDVAVDLDELSLREAAERTADPTRGAEPRFPEEIDLGRLTAPFLAGWYEDWVLDERDRIRRRQVELLKERVRAHLRAGDPSTAAVEATWAITVDPLDEEAHRLLLTSHVAEGNIGEAVDHLRSLGRLMDDELGLPPSPETRRIVEACLLDRRDRAAPTHR